MIDLGIVEETIKAFHTSKHSSTTLLVVHIVDNLKESIFNVPGVLVHNEATKIAPSIHK